MAPPVDTNAPVEAMRAFNRFYTRRIGLLDERQLHGTMTLTEVRVLFELAHGASVSPSALARELGLDAGYLSRLVRSLEGQGHLTRATSPDDARRSQLTLTAKGRKAIASREANTRAHLATVLDGLPADHRGQVVQSMQTLRRLLDDEVATPAASPCLLRDPRPGDIGWVIHRQAALYAAEYGWDWTYEGLVAEICGRFVRQFDPACERCWLAERDGVVVGSVFVVRRSAKVAQLRLLYVEPSARGLGLGARLVDACIAFARGAGYRRMMLWTNDVLVSARKIYEAAGFQLVKEEAHRSFGKDLVGQNWERRL